MILFQILSLWCEHYLSRVIGWAFLRYHDHVWYKVTPIITGPRGELTSLRQCHVCKLLQLRNLNYQWKTKP